MQLGDMNKMSLGDMSNIVTVHMVMINQMIHSLSFDYSDDSNDHEKLLHMLSKHGEVLEKFVERIVKKEETMWNV